MYIQLNVTNFVFVIKWYSNKMEKTIEKIIDSYPGRNRENLLSILQDIQKEYGFIPEKSLEIVGKKLKLPTSKIYGIATFYDEFTFEKKGMHHIRICVGTGCHLAGSEAITKEFEKLLNIKIGETTKDQMFSLETVPCMGACGLAPIIEINGYFHNGVQRKEVIEILTNLKNQTN